MHALCSGLAWLKCLVSAYQIQLGVLEFYFKVVSLHISSEIQVNQNTVKIVNILQKIAQFAILAKPVEEMGYT